MAKPKRLTLTKLPLYNYGRASEQSGATPQVHNDDHIINITLTGNVGCDLIRVEPNEGHQQLHSIQR